jgi:hypothetical protein
MLFDNAEYQFFEIFCHHRSECNHYTANTMDANKAYDYGRTAIPFEGRTPRRRTTHRCHDLR